MLPSFPLYDNGNKTDELSSHTRLFPFPFLSLLFHLFSLFLLIIMSWRRAEKERVERHTHVRFIANDGTFSPRCLCVCVSMMRMILIMSIDAPPGGGKGLKGVKEMASHECIPLTRKYWHSAPASVHLIAQRQKNGASMLELFVFSHWFFKEKKRRTAFPTFILNPSFILRVAGGSSLIARLGDPMWQMLLTSTHTGILRLCIYASIIIIIRLNPFPSHHQCYHASVCVGLIGKELLPQKRWCWWWWW